MPEVEPFDGAVSAGPELFIVEGVSAADAVENVCESHQHVYSMQGKLMNVLRASDREVRANKRVDELFRRVTRNQSAEDDPSHVPFKNVIVLTDPDVDGVHAKALLLTMLDRLLPELIEDGRLFTVRVPQFSFRSSRLLDPVYAYSPEGRVSVLAQLEEHGATDIETSHYKGVASMNSDEIWNVCVNPQSRKMTVLSAEQVAAAKSVLR